MANFMQTLLLLDLFIAGVASGVAAYYALSHFGKHREVPRERTQQLPRKDYLPPAIKEQLLQESKARFESAVNNSGAQLEQDLETTAGLLDKLVKRLGAEIVSTELERYRTNLANLRKQAQADMQGVNVKVTERQETLEAEMTREIAAEKRQLLQQIDTRLADAVGSFLLETLQHNVDLGAQEAYLLSTLEEHKAEFAKQVDNGGSTS